MDNDGIHKFAYRHARIFADLLRLAVPALARFPGAADRAVREVLHAWAGALLAHMAGAESALPSVDELEAPQCRALRPASWPSPASFKGTAVPLAPLA